MHLLNDAILLPYSLQSVHRKRQVRRLSSKQVLLTKKVKTIYDEERVYRIHFSYKAATLSCLLTLYSVWANNCLHADTTFPKLNMPLGAQKSFGGIQMKLKLFSRLSSFAMIHLI